MVDKPQKNEAYLQIYSGNGKGKTTAALGLALRAAGAGKRVYLAQFLKTRPTGEELALRRFPEIVLRRFCPGRKEEPRAEEAAILEELTQEIMTGAWDLVILDEIFAALRRGLVPAAGLLALLNGRPACLEVVLTGRDAPEEFIAQAQLVTEMLERKHYFRKGVKARRGIEF
jgi:cob(I)alamin adenosyltransferase